MNKRFHNCITSTQPSGSRHRWYFRISIGPSLLVLLFCCFCCVRLTSVVTVIASLVALFFHFCSCLLSMITEQTHEFNSTRHTLQGGGGGGGIDVVWELTQLRSLAPTVVGSLPFSYPTPYTFCRFIFSILYSQTISLFRAHTPVGLRRLFALRTSA